MFSTFSTIQYLGKVENSFDSVWGRVIFLKKMNESSLDAGSSLMRSLGK
jgi:hypothetical protein